MAVAAAAIPEGLPIVATRALALALARGMWRMERQNAPLSGYLGGRNSGRDHRHPQ